MIKTSLCSALSLKLTSMQRPSVLCFNDFTLTYNNNYDNNNDNNTLFKKDNTVSLQLIFS